MPISHCLHRQITVCMVFLIVGLGWTVAAGQSPPGAYSDVQAYPDGPAAERVKELINVVNGADSARVRKFVEEAFTPEFRDFASMEEHVGVFTDFARETGGVEFYGVRKYEKPPFEGALVVILRAKLTDSWQAFVINLEEDPPHRFKALQFAPARPPSDLPPATPLTEAEMIVELGRYMEKLGAADAFSGTVLLAKDGKILFQGAYGQADKNFGVPNRIDTKFNLGSMNKMFTATAVMQLVERGKLKLDDTLADRLGGAWLPDEVARKITIEHLLTHTSGLGSYFNDKFDALSREKLREVDDYIPLVADERPQFEPGTAWAYSNTGMLLLGAVIERITGENYYEYIRRNIYAPAGMTNSDCYDLDRVVPNLAIGYTRARDESGTHWETNTFKHVIRGGPAGGGYSTVEDLLRFDQALRAGKLVSRESVEKMWTATPLSSTRVAGYGYGFGFIVLETPAGKAVGHSGGFQGISGLLRMYLDSGYTLAVLSNYNGGAPLVEQKVSEWLWGLK